jgi:hypothetical protein
VKGVVCASLCVEASEKSVTIKKIFGRVTSARASCHPQPPAGAQVARRAPLARVGRCCSRLRAPRPRRGAARAGRGGRGRAHPPVAPRGSARSARVAARGGCAGGAAVGGRGASAGGLACSVRGVARLGGGGGGVDARRAAAATRALGSGDARDGYASYDDKLAAARAARAMKPTQGGGGGRAAAVALNRLITQEEIPEGLL